MKSDPKTQTQLAARRILAVTEEELRRIILDIHDGPVQHIFAALSQTNMLQRQFNNPPEAVDTRQYLHRLDQISGSLQAALADIRHFLGTFHPPDFSKRSIIDILQGLILQHETLTDCRVEFDVRHHQLPAALPVKIALYRICQEALSNAYCHSGTQKQRVCLDREGDMIVLEVADEGQGFEPPPLSGPDATEQAEHIGLRGMRERVGLVNGRFHLHTLPNQGTRITVHVPLEK